jgi:hypothetical protein
MRAKFEERERLSVLLGVFAEEEKSAAKAGIFIATLTARLKRVP